MSEKDFSKTEFVGSGLKVLESTNKFQQGISGQVIYETKSTFHLLTKKGFKIIPKENCVFNFFTNKGNPTINGSILNKRPFERMELKN